MESASDWVLAWQRVGQERASLMLRDWRFLTLHQETRDLFETFYARVYGKKGWRDETKQIALLFADKLHLTTDCCLYPENWNSGNSGSDKVIMVNDYCNNIYGDI